MANFTAGDTRLTVTGDALANAQSAGTVVMDSRRTRPLWFDGRFLAARDLAREQNYFLQRQADLGRAAGFGVVQGLWVSMVSSGGSTNSETLVIQAGHGITPAGELVMIPTDLTVRISDLVEEQKLDVAFGVSEVPKPPARTRTGVYVVGLRPVEFTANPIASYPTSIQGTRTTHDGDIVEATAVTLVPYPDPVSNQDGSQRRAALAQQIFLRGNQGQTSSALLPIAMVSIQRGVIEWVDPYLVRRDTGPEYNGIRFGLSDPATQQAFLLQYDSMLQQTLTNRQHGGLSASFAASDYFRVIPSAGRFPLASINVNNFSQVFFPQQLDVRMSVIPVDELPALLEDSLSLPPLDLTLAADAYENLAVFALIPVPRDGFAALKASLPDVPLVPIMPQVLSFRQPVQLLRLYTGALTVTPPPPVANAAWAKAIGTQTFGFYIRRRSAPVFVDFTTATS